MDSEARGDHVVPTYRAADGEAWFHFLHGNVPGHEIDFLYRPEVPQGALDRQHYTHLLRLVRYLEPHARLPYAFTLGNLSRDDTQHEPGHGGMALVFALRVHGATDHAGRPDPPFSHAIAAVDRALDAPAILRAALAFHHQVLDGAASAEWYREYARASTLAQADVGQLLAAYVARFADLPRLDPSAMSLAWTTRGAAAPGRIVLVHPDDAPFEVLARAAARIGAVLYRSDVRWSAISSGREADLPGGTTVRFLPESAAGDGDAAPIRRAIDAVPEDEEAIARELFGAFPVASSGFGAGAWSDRPAEEEPDEEEDESAITRQMTPTASPAEPPAPLVPIPIPLPLVEPPPPEPSAPAPRPRRSRWRSAVAVASILAGVSAMLWRLLVPPPQPPQVAESATVTPPPVAPPAEPAVSTARPVSVSTLPTAKPPAGSGTATRPAAGKRPAVRGCVVVGGKPCF